MESEFDLIDVIVSVCEELDLPYAIGGSMASMSYGEFRATADLDVVLSLRAIDVPRFLDRFPKPEYYHDERVRSLGRLARGSAPPTIQLSSTSNNRVSA